MIGKISRGSLNVLHFELIWTYCANYKFRLYLWWSPLSLNCCFKHFLFSRKFDKVAIHSLHPESFLALPKWTLNLFKSTLNFIVWKYFFFQRTPNSRFTFHLVYFHLAQTSISRNKVSLLLRFFDCPLFIGRVSVSSPIVTENARLLWGKTKWKPDSVQSSLWPSCDWHLRN